MAITYPSCFTLNQYEMCGKIQYLSFSLIQFSRSVVSDSSRLHGPRHARPPFHHQLLEFTQTHVHWVGDAIKSSHPLSSHSHPAFNLSSIRVFSNESVLAAGGQSIGASASASVLPMNIQDWFLLGLMGLISLLSRGGYAVFSSTTIWKHQLFSNQPASWSNSHIRTWALDKA